MIEYLKLAVALAPTILETIKSQKSEDEFEVESIDIQSSLEQHLREVANWASRIQFFGMAAAMDTDHTSVPLHFHTTPRKFRGRMAQECPTDESQLLAGSSNILILGDPGAGKTTTIKRLAIHLLSESKTPEDCFKYPLLIRMKDLDEGETISEHIIEKVGLKKHLKQDVSDLKKKKRYEYLTLAGKSLINQIAEFVNHTKCLLLIDGLDETGLENFNAYTSELSCLAGFLSQPSIITSCRSGDYVRTFENFDVIEILPLDYEQIESIGQAWLGDKFDGFLETVAQFPNEDLLDRPLILSQLLFLYSRQGDLPEQPSSIYSQITRLLLRDWDYDRDVKRVSKYAFFTPDKKAAFLSAVSYKLTFKVKEKAFNSNLFTSIYEEICEDFNLPNDDSLDVLGEVESHTGLIVDAGFGKYEFSHLSLQEYLCADYIVKSPFTETIIDYLIEYPAPIATAVALSSNPSNWISDLILNDKFNGIYIEGVSHSSIHSFLDRLILEKPYFRKCESVGFAFLLMLDCMINPKKAMMENLSHLKGVTESLAMVLKHYAINKEESMRSDSFNLVMLSSQFKEKNFAGPRNVNIPKDILLTVIRATDAKIDWMDTNEFTYILKVTAKKYYWTKVDS
jgi:DNA polymerase III delta prime subunit